ncbi:DUF3343 domain-containing protein [Atlantibacter hermannii]|uniref:DUF3343 domain-containing protein n=1 Tax=Atlantibacter hermannii TaxID=565 RepID=UPI0022B78F17|nr:DUF3343 domain-containing protein [Atlantibacter hermannii]MCZ7834111.1 DUF3343 domain-containing protein [Atlantibacter hermannii]
MTEYLFLFHSTLGVVKTRRALQAAGAEFRVTDIPRQLRGGCGLCVWIVCPEEGYQEWVMAGLTQSVYRVEGEQWKCIATYPSG